MIELQALLAEAIETRKERETWRKADTQIEEERKKAIGGAEQASQDRL